MLEKILEPPARPRAVSVIAEMPVTPIGKIFKPKLREIAAGEAARELLAAEGLATMSVSRRSPTPRAGCSCASRRHRTRPSPRNGCCKSFRSRSSLRREALAALNPARQPVFPAWVGGPARDFARLKSLF